MSDDHALALTRAIEILRCHGLDAEADHVRELAGELGEIDDRDRVFVHADFNPDVVRYFYEIPDRLTDVILETAGQPRTMTFVEALVDWKWGT